MEKETNLPPKKGQNDYSRRIFILGIEVIFYFGIPAIIGALVSKWLKVRYPDQNYWTFIILGVTYFLSWFIVFWRYKAIKNKYNK